MSLDLRWQFKIVLKCDKLKDGCEAETVFECATFKDSYNLVIIFEYGTF